MDIRVKSYFGGWKTVERERAKEIISKMLDGGCRRKSIDENYLIGITVDELLPRNTKPQVVISEMENTAPMLPQEPKPSNKNMVEIKDCVVEMEMLAREEAFLRFEQNILFSLMIWQNDERIREKLPSVSAWLSGCIEKLNSITA